MKWFALIASLALAQAAHAATNLCEMTFMTDFDQNYAIYQGSDGRVSPEFAARTRVVYNIGGKSYPLETIVDKSVDIELQPDVVRKALAFDSVHGGRDAQRLVERFLNMAPDRRFATITRYNYLNHNRPDDVTIEANRDISFKNQPRSGDQLSLYAPLGKEMLNALFRVKAIRAFETTEHVESDRDYKTAVRRVTYTKTQLSPAVLHSLIGQRVSVEETKMKSIGGYVLGAQISDNGTRLAIRFLETFTLKVRLLEYDLNSTDLKGIFITGRTSWNERFEAEGLAVGDELALSPHESSTVSLQRLDLSKPVYLAYASYYPGPAKFTSKTGTLILPSREEELQSLLNNKPLFVTLKTAEGEERINQLSIFRAYGTRK